MIQKFIPKHVLEARADETCLVAISGGVDPSYPFNVEDVVEFHLGYDLHLGADLPPKMSGSTDPVKRIVYVSEHITNDGRRRFTIAHEIAHIVLHLPVLRTHAEGQLGLFDLNFLELAQDDRMEWQANYFAAGLLMPRSAMIEQFGERARRGGLIDAREVASYFGVSVQAADRRLRELEFVLSSSPGTALNFTL